MYYTKRLILLTICVVTLGSATESQYLDYAIESLDYKEIQVRQIEKNDTGFQMETEIEVYHPELNSSKHDFSNRSHKSYARKSAYY